MSSEQTQWVITLTFAALGVLSLAWLATDRRRPLLIVSNLLHLAMCVAMVAMEWAGLSTGWTTALLVTFVLGTVWFGALAVLRATGRVRRRAIGEHGVWQLVGHAVMMLGMVWMLAVMAGGSGHHRHHDGLTTGPALSGVAATAALVATGVLLVVAFAECVATSRGLRRHAGDLAGGAVMSLAMAAACWGMLG